MSAQAVAITDHDKEESGRSSLRGGLKPDYVVSYWQQHALGLHQWKNGQEQGQEHKKEYHYTWPNQNGQGQQDQDRNSPAPLDYTLTQEDLSATAIA